MEVSREAALLRFPDVTVCPLRNLDVSVLRSLFAQLNATRSPVGALRLDVPRAEPDFELPYLAKIGQFYSLYHKYYSEKSATFGMAMSRSNMFANFELDVLQKGMIPSWELMVRCRCVTWCVTWGSIATTVPVANPGVHRGPRPRLKNSSMELAVI